MIAELFWVVAKVVKVVVRLVLWFLGCYVC